jgi:S-adenosylmethionine synthetase
MKLYSNEIVFRGHPDKVCDQISDALLDACLKQDKLSRCGIEVVGGKGTIFITGEITSNAVINVEAIAKRVLEDIGYSSNYNIINNIGKQSNDIAQGVDVGGAGDNGMMFGYACNDTEHSLPTAMVILQKFSKQYDELRKIDTRFKPDGKTQITGLYDADFKLKEIKTFTICYQNTEVDRDETDEIIKKMVEKIANKYGIKIHEFLINPTGKFEIGGFEGDAGLTGRKIVVDSYQSFANVGGGAFSGKDPSKVDRSGAYKAREIAKKELKARNLKWCEVQLSYAIGIERPLAIYIDSSDGIIEPTDELYEECKPFNIITDLKLREIKYEEKARFGHFS